MYKYSIIFIVIWFKTKTFISLHAVYAGYVVCVAYMQSCSFKHPIIYFCLTDVELELKLVGKLSWALTLFIVHIVKIPQ